MTPSILICDAPVLERFAGKGSTSGKQHATVLNSPAVALDTNPPKWGLVSTALVTQDPLNVEQQILGCRW